MQRQKGDQASERAQETAPEQPRAQPEAEEVRLEERRELEKCRRRTRGHAFVAAMASEQRGDRQVQA